MRNLLTIILLIIPLLVGAQIEVTVRSLNKERVTVRVESKFNVTTETMLEFAAKQLMDALIFANSKDAEQYYRYMLNMFDSAGYEGTPQERMDLIVADTNYFLNKKYGHYNDVFGNRARGL